MLMITCISMVQTLVERFVFRVNALGQNQEMGRTHLLPRLANRASSIVSPVRGPTASACVHMSTALCQCPVIGSTEYSSGVGRRVVPLLPHWGSKLYKSGRPLYNGLNLTGQNKRPSYKMAIMRNTREKPVTTAPWAPGATAKSRPNRFVRIVEKSQFAVSW